MLIQENSQLVDISPTGTHFVTVINSVHPIPIADTSEQADLSDQISPSAQYLYMRSSTFPISVNYFTLPYASFYVKNLQKYIFIHTPRE